MQLNIGYLLSIIVYWVHGHCYDPCQRIALQLVVSYNESLACYRNFLMTDFIRDQTELTLNRTLNFLPLTESDKLGLKLVFNKKYQFEYEFQLSLREFFSRRWDKLGTNYVPNCFHQFEFRLPLGITIEQDTDSKLIVRSVKLRNEHDLLNKFIIKLGFEFKRYLNLQIIRMDGMDPINYLQRLGKELGVRGNDNLGTQVNHLVSKSLYEEGDWKLVPGLISKRTIPPNKGSIKMIFLSEGGELWEVDVPYLVRIPSGFSDSISFYKNYGLNHPNTDHLMLVNQCTNKKGNPPELSKPSHVYSFIQVQPVSSYTVALGISGLGTKFQSEWKFQLKQSLIQLIELDPKNLILDLSNNLNDNNENNCHVYNLINYLFPESNFPPLPSEMISTDLLLLLSSTRRSLKFNLREFNDLGGLEINNINDFKSVWSQYRTSPQMLPPIVEQCPDNFLIGLPSLNLSGNLTVITNGLCHGPCAILVNILIRNFKIPTYTMSSLPDTPPASNPYSTTLTLSELLSSINNASLTYYPNTPPPLPTKSQLKFTLRQTLTSTYPHQTLITLPKLSTIHLPNLPGYYLDTTRYWRQLGNELDLKLLNQTTAT